MALPVLEPVLLLSEIGVGIYGTDRLVQASIELVLSGPYWWVFWFGQIAIGLAIPIVILATRLGRDPRLVSAAALAALIGFAAFRLNIVIPGLSPEEIAGITPAVSDPRISNTGGAYFTDGDKLLDGPKLPGTKPKQIGYAIDGTDPRRRFFTSSGKVEFANAKFADKKGIDRSPGRCPVGEESENPRVLVTRGTCGRLITCGYDSTEMRVMHDREACAAALDRLGILLR